MAKSEKSPQEKLNEVLELLAGGTNGKDSPWGAEEEGGVFDLIQGVAIPINMGTPKGRLRCYLSFPAEVAKDQKTLTDVIGHLVKHGVPVDFYGGNNGGTSGRNWQGQPNGGAR